MRGLEADITEISINIDQFKISLNMNTSCIAPKPFSFAHTSVYASGSARPAFRATVVAPEGAKGQGIVFVNRTTKLHSPFRSGALRTTGATGSEIRRIAFEQRTILGLRLHNTLLHTPRYNYCLERISLPKYG